MCDVSAVSRVSRCHWAGERPGHNWTITIFWYQPSHSPVWVRARAGSASPGPRPPAVRRLAAHPPGPGPGSVSGHPGRQLTPGPGRDSETDLMRVRGPDIKFISRVGWTNQSPAFRGAWCQPGHSGQCGGSIRNCLINLIGFVSAHSSLGPSIKWCQAPPHLYQLPIKIWSPVDKNKSFSGISSGPSPLGTGLWVHLTQDMNSH